MNLTPIKALCFFAIVMINFLANAQEALQIVDSKTINHDICIYKPNPFANPSYVPVPKVIRDKIDSQDRSSACSTINVTYTGFTTEAQTAFQYAVDIWASLIDTSVPIEINATFGPLGPGVIGSAGAFTYLGLTGGSLPEVTFHPIALANSLLGSDQRINDPDINATFSNTFNFYFGTDGATPSGQIDFVTVVLHEIGHGLGIAGFGREVLDINDNPTGEGAIRYSGFAGIWDHHIENSTPTSIISTSNYPDPSVALYGQLTSDDLFSNGAQATVLNGNVKPKIYAPNTWNSGSSYSHWDENYYPSGNPQALMTPQVGYGEANHNPGTVTLAFMEDMGWSLCGSPLSTESFEDFAQVSLYPNPVKDLLTIKSNEVIKLVCIYNTLGQEIFKIEPNKLETSINFEQLKNGVYYTNVTIGKNTKNYKIVKTQ
ncbi:hypothetical protein KH5_04040 [Urechidicola sp. KH5]